MTHFRPCMYVPAQMSDFIHLQAEQISVRSYPCMDALKDAIVDGYFLMKVTVEHS